MDMSIEDQINSEPGDSLAETSEDWRLIEAVEEHLRPYFGEVERVFDQSSPGPVHIDLHLFEASPEDELRTFVTTGLAQKPMNVPSEVEDPDEYRYAELLLHLPMDWPLEWGIVEDESRFWPIHAMSGLANIPHSRESWIWGGHTMKNGDLEPYSPDTQLCAAIVCPSFLLPDDAEIVKVGDGRSVVLLTVAFIYREEFEFCVENGSEAFFDRIEESGLTPFEFFVLDKKRRNVCASQ